jgi:hypothetical protein
MVHQSPLGEESHLPLPGSDGGYDVATAQGRGDLAPFAPTKPRFKTHDIPSETAIMAGARKKIVSETYRSLFCTEDRFRHGG